MIKKEKRTCYTDGNKEILLLPTDKIPYGFKKGTLYSRVTTLGKHWYNNGEIQLFLSDTDKIPDGFHRGRLPFTEEHHKNLSRAQQGRQSPMKGRKTTKQAKQKQSNAHKNKIYINNGIDTLFIDKNDVIPMGYKKGKLLSEESHQNISRQAKERWSNFTKEKLTIIRNKIVSASNETKRARGTFNTSNPENDYYQFLLKEYSKLDVFRHYKSDKYPFYCDFYIKSEDKFIELNLHWTHGGRPYDPNDIECQEKLKIWQEKAKTSQFYQNAIQTWTVRDVVKRNTANINNLNIEFIYNI